MEELKYDKDKNRLELIPTELIEEVGKVLTYGAHKYAPNAWRKAKKSELHRFVGAAMRHLEEYRKGNYFDDESGLPHLAHLATNVAFLLALDKPKAPTAKYAGATKAEVEKFDTVEIAQIEYKRNIEHLVEYVYSVAQYKSVALLYIPTGGERVANDIAEELNNLGVSATVAPLTTKEQVGSTGFFVVDDIIDTGKTIREKVPNHATVLVPFKRHNAEVGGLRVVVGTILHHNHYIKFPWEVENVD